jgi:hypothetical protein
MVFQGASWVIGVAFRNSALSLANTGLIGFR